MEMKKFESINFLSGLSTFHHRYLLLSLDTSQLLVTGYLSILSHLRVGR